MKILFDLYTSQYGSYHGGKEYAHAVFLKLCDKKNELELINNNISIEIIYNPDDVIENIVIETCNKNNIVINYCKNHSDINILLNNNNYNIFYSPLPYSLKDLKIPSETKFIYTIHGLRSLELPIHKYWNKFHKGKLYRKIIMTLMYRFNFIKNIILKKRIKYFGKIFLITNNQKIITISQHSRYSIAYYFPNVNINDIDVLYSPLKRYELIKSSENNYLTSLSLESGKYILLICGNITAKGCYLGCSVLYDLLNHSRFPKDIKIILIGVGNKNIYRKLVKNNPRFIFTGYVSSEELEILYKNAHLFLYPTLNEGFGYPPLEAMKYGTICACSANSSLTEVYKDSIIYFNPYDQTEMSIRILQSFDNEIRKEKAEKIKNIYKLITEKQNVDLDILTNMILSIK